MKLGKCIFGSILVLSPIAVLSADLTKTDFIAESNWQPLYEQCSTKMHAGMEATISMIDPDDITEKVAQNIEVYRKAGTEQADTICTCFTESADTAFSNAGVEMSEFEINYLAESFRYETLYPDPIVRELFGAATLRCVL